MKRKHSWEKQTVISFASLGMRIGSNFFLGVIVAKFLNPGSFGIFSMGTAILAILLPLCIVGLENYILVIASSVRDKLEQAPQEFETLKRLCYQGLLFSLLWSGAIFLLFALISGLSLFFNGNPTTTFVIVSILFTVITYGPTEILLFALQGLGNVVPKMFVLHFWLPFFRMVLAISGLLLGWGIYAIAAAYIGSAVALPLAGWLSLKRNYPPLVDFRRSHFRMNKSVVFGLVKNSFPLVGITGLTIVIQNLDNILVGGFGGAKEAGLYGLALKLSMFLTIGNLALTNLINPLITNYLQNGKMKEYEQIMSRSVFIYSIFTVPAWLAMVLAPEQIIVIVSGREYLPAALPLILLATGQLLFSLFSSFSWSLASTNYRVVDIGILAVSLATGILLNVMLDGQYGALGAAIANMSSLILLMGLRIGFTARKFQLRLPAFQPVLYSISGMVLTCLLFKFALEGYMKWWAAVIIAAAVGEALLIGVNKEGRLWLFSRVQTLIRSYVYRGKRGTVV